MGKSQGSTSRRKFIKGLGGGALATAAATALSGAGCSTGGRTEWTSTYDWICAGSGVAGLAATIRGHDLGMKTLLLEKTDKIGGITSQTGGGSWMPMHYLQKAAGIQDSREQALNYVYHVGSGYARKEYSEAYVDNAARVIDYLHQKADVEFTTSDPPSVQFYDPAVIPRDAVVRGRLISSKPFPSETLGAWRNKVRQSLWIRGFPGSLGGRESGVTDGPARIVERQVEAWKKRLGPAKFEELVRKDEEQRQGGQALISYLFRAVLKRGIDVRVETEVERLLEENGQVVGVVVNQNGKRENIRANKGVLLALGNAMLGMDVGWGAGWMLAAQVGGKLHSEPHIIAQVMIYVPEEIFPNGKPAGRVNYERFMQHGLVVNRFGERFEREAFYGALGTKVNVFDDFPDHRFRNVPNFQIFDRQLLEKYSFGGMPPGNMEGLEWVTQGGTLAELARKMKLPIAKLEATVARFNGFARQGKDVDFDRDPATLGTIEKPPFYGIENFTPDPYAEMHTTVVTNPQGQVLHYQTEKPIPGLYCAGALLTSSRVYGVGYPGGLQVGGGQIFGFLAAEQAAVTTT